MQKRLTQNVIAFIECSLSNKKKNKKKNCILKKQNEITNNETKKTKQKKTNKYTEQKFHYTCIKDKQSYQMFLLIKQFIVELSCEVRLWTPGVPRRRRVLRACPRVSPPRRPRIGWSKVIKVIPCWSKTNIEPF